MVTAPDAGGKSRRRTRPGEGRKGGAATIALITVVAVVLIGGVAGAVTLAGGEAAG